MKYNVNHISPYDVTFIHNPNMNVPLLACTRIAFVLILVTIDTFLHVQYMFDLD